MPGCLRGLLPLSFILSWALSGLTGHAAAQESLASPAVITGEVISILSPRTSLEIVERFSRVLQFPEGIVRVDGFDPNILAISALPPLPGEHVSRQIRVQALAQGVTTIVVTAEPGQVYSIEVMVTGDARAVQAMLRRLFPNTAVQVTMIRNTILLRGWVAEPHQITEIVDIASRYGAEVLNQMKVAGPQDVQLRVKILEAQRSAIRRFGINFAAGGRNAMVVSTPGPITALETFAVPFGGPPSATFASNQLSNASLALGIATDNFIFESLIQALKEEGLLKISAEPVLVTRSGEGARLVNGGEFPIPVPQSLGTVTIEWREFGVSLESLPIVLGPNLLKQQIRAEVSERDFSTAVTLGGTTVPGLTKRTVETQTVMEFGQTLVIGGLISTRYTADTSKIPVLGELPGVGALFRRVTYNTAETELVVLITPEYVSAMPPEQVLPGGPGQFTTVPTDRELYGSGVLEVPNYGQGAPVYPPAHVMPTPVTSPPSSYPPPLPSPAPRDPAPPLRLPTEVAPADELPPGELILPQGYRRSSTERAQRVQPAVNTHSTGSTSHAAQPGPRGNPSSHTTNPPDVSEKQRLTPRSGSQSPDLSTSSSKQR
ncbi:MAG: hypothetical protein KatS3mg113_0056 [Planctomycetaceae bacterium]|nr:MAG: hypothetical protein KatS3mg113_0056 [Planctomycetaceae bacterium]